MREHMADRPWQFPPIQRQRRCTVGLCLAPGFGAKIRAGYLHHPGKQALLGPAPKEDGAIAAALDPIGDTEAARSLWHPRPFRQIGGKAAREGAAIPLPRANFAAWRAWRADRRAKIHHRLGKIARPMSRCEQGRVAP